MQLSVSAADEAAARRFYLEELGFEQASRPESIAHIPGFWMAVGRAAVHVGIEEGIDRRKTQAHTAFEVEGLELWRDRLIQSGCEIKPSIPIPGRDRIEFRDPFGNSLEFLEYKSF